MKWLRESGLETAILKLENTIIFGICGGYQMLGEKITDTYGAEDYGEIRGMGLLPIITTFEQEKTRTRTEGVVTEMKGEFQNLSGVKVSGYEIHMGKSIISRKEEMEECDLQEGNFLYIDGHLEGYQKGNVIGCYLHGIFDEEEFRKRLLEILCKQKGIEWKQEDRTSYQEYKESQYDKLADILRENIDMKRIYEIMLENGEV